MKLDDISIYLPKYLSPSSKDELFEDLKSFPNNIDNKGKFYSTFLKSDIIHQGDGIDNMMVVNLPNTEQLFTPCLIISNTCDVDPKNKRFFSSRIAYCPIINLEKYIGLLKDNFSKDQLEQHINSIKRQSITQIFYLPKGCFKNNNEEAIVFLDRINSCQNENIDRNNISKLFSLNNYGWYILLIKLSIHFTRMNENIDRNISYM